jgi:hypothetical protein
MRRIAAKFVPQLLTNDQKQRRVNVSLVLRENANEDPTFISMMIMGNESSIYGYDPETSIVAVEEPTITNSKRGAAGPEFNKEHAHCFFLRKVTLHREFVPPNATPNSDFYCGFSDF